MADAAYVIVILDLVILLIILILSLIYLLPIIFVRRFHTAANILTGNVCLAGIIASLFWIVYNILSAFYRAILIQSTAACFLTSNIQIMVNCLVIYALKMITINRFFTIVYPNKRLFKRQAWSFISSGIQWMVAIILSLPNLIFSFQICIYGNNISFWISWYHLFIIVILPSIVNVVFNSLIFIKVRSSTRRVHTMTTIKSSIANPNHQHARDVYLLKHMLFIFTAAIIGWAPVYIVSIVIPDGQLISWVDLLLQVLPALSSLINIIDLFFYNRNIRRYLKEQLLNYLHFNRS